MPRFIKLHGPGREVLHMLTSKLSHLCSNLNLAINCHPRVPQAGRCITVSTISWMDAKLGTPSAGISWWALTIPLSFAKTRRAIASSLNKIPNSCSNLQGALHQWHCCIPVRTDAMCSIQTMTTTSYISIYFGDD